MEKWERTVVELPIIEGTQPHVVSRPLGGHLLSKKPPEGPSPWDPLAAVTFLLLLLSLTLLNDLVLWD